ncbi:hypothetical protein Patl1_21935 [Pistacia atlantica]|uniref:Uncharacterized protein n=1 Tax=Pistacia atlantica TaxID=434234 RepID=A0ACC1BI44_9ROSI|nr:hypothetical protein Patl1_21935 [Pistacia atlantica]
MNTQKNIHVPPLSDEDAWNLFVKIVGDLAEKSDFQPIATEIVKKCAGLPVAISAIANALRNESLYTWEDALTQLKKSNPRCTPGQGVRTLLKKVEDLYLHEMNGVRNVLYELHEDGFPHLKHLLVQDGLELLYIVNSFSGKLAFPQLESLVLRNLINLEKICHGQLNVESFSKIRILKIEKCDRLEYLFASVVAKNFTQLQEMEVTGCKNLKGILGEESKDHGDEIETDDMIEFSQLCSLTLQHLPQFIKIGSDMRVVFPRLENLKLCSINIENTRLSQPLAMPSYSQCLKSLTVEECNGLKFLFSSSMVKSLKQLNKLVIGNCKSMEVIIDLKGEEGEEKIIDMSFPKLFYLKLEVLPKLVSFGIGNSIKFPSLKELHIDSCPNLKAFFCKSFYPNTVREETEEEVNLENYSIDINPLFDEKVAFPNLEVMVLLHLDNLQLIWHNQQLHAESFRELKEVRVQFCEKLKTIVPSNSQGLLTFHNLDRLTVTNCWSMKSLFPVSIATGLVQLKMLYIVSSGLEKIVSEEEVNGAPTFLFPQLTVVHLDNLPKLKCFYSGLHTTEWPLLNSLRVYGCKKIKIYASEFPSFQRKDDGESKAAIFLLEKIGFCNLEYLKLSDFPSLKEKIWNGRLPVGLFCNVKRLVLDEVFDMSSSFPSHVLYDLKNLETLEVSNCHSLKDLFDIDGQTLKNNEEEILGFNNLKSLKVHNCGSLRYLFTPSIILGLDKLQVIEVKNCDLIEEIIMKDEEQNANIDKIIIPHLKSIVLELLPNLVNFYSGSNDLECPSLKSITIANCPKMESFVFTDLKEKSCSDYTSHLFSEKVAFPNLEVMVLLHMDNLQLIWHNQQLHAESFRELKEVRVQFCEKLKTIVPSNSHELLTFHNLDRLTVTNCWSMKSLFPVSIATGLVQLKMLYIVSSGLEKIVSEEEVNGAPTFLFPQLTDFHLVNLPKLECFYSGLHTTEWPLLNSLCVYGCKKIKIYASEFPSFQGKDDWESQPAIFLLEKVIPNLEVLGLDAHDFKLTFLHCDLAKSFGKLKKLYLGNFDDESIASLSGFLQSCESLEQVFDLERLNANGLALEENRQEILGLKKLKSLKIDNCNSLRYVFTPSILLGLDQLQEIEVKNCALIEEIIEKEAQKDASSDKIVIPQLNSVVLESLPNLARFYSGSDILECPPLETIIIKDCQNIHMKEFSVHLASLFTVKVVLPSLEASSCFQNLTILVIDGFDHLKYLLPSSMVKSVFRLKELEISNCKFMERVIDEDEERSSTMLFPKLYQLKLRDLPKLTTFCNSTAKFVEMSSLFRLWIDGCPAMQTFISSFVCGAMTSSSKDHEEMNTKENFTHMQSLFDKKVRLPSLERLQISYADQLMSGRHQKLEFLEVQNCDSVEEIFEVLEKSSSMVEELVEKEEAVRRFVFSNLIRLCLQMLPSLKSFYPEIHISEWPILEELKVYGCDNVEIFASELLSIQGTHGESQQPLFFVYKV